MIKEVCNGTTMIASCTMWMLKEDFCLENINGDNWNVLKNFEVFTARVKVTED